MLDKMKASVLHGIADVRCEMVDVPKIEADEVLVNVKYAGICGSDLPRAMISGLSGNAQYPLILGHEFSGQIAEVGDKVTSYKTGDKVTVAPLVPCGHCEYCKSGNYGLCGDYQIIGTRVNGAFAEFVKVKADHLLKLPEGLDYETAAGLNRQR